MSFSLERGVRCARNEGLIEYTEGRYIRGCVPIASFDDHSTERFYASGKVSKGTGWSNVAKIVRRKLDMVEYAAQMVDLASPPGNHLEALRGDLKGWHSIRVNDQWRIFFIWKIDGAHGVKVIDYH